MQFVPHQNSSVEPSTEEQLIVHLSRFHDLEFYTKGKVNYPRETRMHKS